jgi:hypothetical protein
MFSITLWHSGSGSGSVFSKRENSTKRPGSGTRRITYDCTLKDPTSLHNPVFVLKLDPAKSPHFNYAYVPDWGRYYFVTDITFVTQSICEISLKVDVLATYKNEIGASEQYVIRSYSDYDENAVDSLYPALSKTSKQISTFTGTTSLNRDIDEGFYVFGYIDVFPSSVIPASKRYGVLYVVLTAKEFSVLCGCISDAEESTLGIADPLRHVVSVKWVPFAPNYTAYSNVTIELGLSVSYQPAVYRLIENPIWSSSAFSVDIPKHPEASARGNYLNIAPFSSYILYNPLTGEYPIDALLLAGFSKLWFRIKCDCVTGASLLTLFVVSGSAEIVIGTINCVMGVDIEMTSDKVNVLDAGLDFVKAGGALASENYIGAISGVTSALQSCLPKVQTVGQRGSFLPYDYNFNLRSEFTYTAPEDRANRGRPLMQTKTINTLSGYVQCADADISLSATAEEQTKVKAYLESGFFYE